MHVHVTRNDFSGPIYLLLEVTLRWLLVIVSYVACYLHYHHVRRRHHHQHIAWPSSSLFVVRHRLIEVLNCHITQWGGSRGCCAMQQIHFAGMKMKACAQKTK